MFDSLDTALDLMRRDGPGRWYMGKVVVNVDPLGRDRIQVRAPGLYDPDMGPVPWVGPIKISPFGIGGSWGVYGSPAIGSDVLILLQDGDGHYPMYMSVQTSSSAPAFPSGAAWGFTDPYGNTLKMSADNSVSFTAASGATVSISAGGDIAVNAPGSVSVNAGSGASVTSPNNTINGTTTINGNTTINGALLNNGVNIGSSHRHNYSGSGGTTTTPV